MITLNNDNRLRLLWHFLIKAAKVDLLLSADAIHEVFGTTQNDFDYIQKICTEQNLTNPIDLIEGQDVTDIPFDQDMIEKLTHRVPEFAQFSEKEQQDLELLTAKYFALSDQRVHNRQTLYAALDFWQSLNPELIADSIKSQVIEKLTEINKLCFVRNPRSKNLSERIDHRFQNFRNFTSDHAFLIMYNKDWSKTLEGLNDIKTYYQREQEEVEGQKLRVENLIKNTKKNLDTKVAEVMAKHEAMAAKLVVSAKSRYTENLLAGYAERFQSDAERYGQSASRWLRGLFLSFFTTFLIAFYFLGHLKIESQPLNSSIIDQFIDGLIMVGSWYLLIFIVISVYFGAKGYIVPSLEAFGIEVSVPISFKEAIMEAVRITLGFTLFLVLIYLVVSHFDMTVESPSISAETFLIPAGSEINWAALLSGAAPRFLVLALVAAVTLFCARMYRIQKHLQSVNQYRVAALASFDTFINALGEETDETRARKEKLFDELANLIYSPIQTGFTDDNRLKTADLANLIATAMRNTNQK